MRRFRLTSKHRSSLSRPISAGSSARRLRLRSKWRRACASQRSAGSIGLVRPWFDIWIVCSLASTCASRVLSLRCKNGTHFATPWGAVLDGTSSVSCQRWCSGSIESVYSWTMLEAPSANGLCGSHASKADVDSSVDILASRLPRSPASGTHPTPRARAAGKPGLWS